MSRGWLSGATACCAQIGFGPFATTSTCERFPAIVRSASDVGAYCSASPSSRVLTLWS